jgi:hypothetical protein
MLASGLPQPESAATATNTKKMAAHFGSRDEVDVDLFLAEEKYGPIILHFMPAQSAVKAFRFQFKNSPMERTLILPLTARCAQN